MAAGADQGGVDSGGLGGGQGGDDVPGELAEVPAARRPPCGSAVDDGANQAGWVSVLGEVERDYPLGVIFYYIDNRLFYN